MKQIATDNYYNINSFLIEEGDLDITNIDCKVCIDLMLNGLAFQFMVNKEKTKIECISQPEINFKDWTFELFFYSDINLSGNWNILLTRGLINVNMKTITFVVDGRDR